MVVRRVGERQGYGGFRWWNLPADLGFGAFDDDGRIVGSRRDWIFSSTRSSVSMSHLCLYLPKPAPLVSGLENYHTAAL